jgi:hypothetical protein
MGNIKHIKCVDMFGYWRQRAHCNAHTWVDLKVVLTTFQSTNISKMQIKNWLFDYGGIGTLKDMKLFSNKPCTEQAYNAQGLAKDIFSLNLSRHHLY